MRTPILASARRHPVLTGLVVCALVLAGIVAWRLSESESKTTAGEVVAEFYLAQEAGDCERVLAVVSEESWSDGGKRSRDEFLELCSDALAEYEPSVDEVEIEYDEDKVLVRAADSNARHAPEGGLVREDGEWKVVTDARALQLGPPPEAAVLGYLDAYAAGDCEAITTFVTEETWSEDGTLGREEFLAQCAAAVDARPESSIAGLATSTPTVTRYDDEKATVLIQGYVEPAKITVVRQDLRWRIRGGEQMPGAPAGTYLLRLRYDEVQASLVDHPILGGRSCHNYVDYVTGTSFTGIPEPPRSLDAIVTVSRDFSTCDAGIALVEFADAKTARRAVGKMAKLLLDEGGRSVAVPGHAEAIGVHSTISATVFMAHGNQVIATSSQFGSFDQAAQLLSAQLEEL